VTDAFIVRATSLYMITELTRHLGLVLCGSVLTCKFNVVQSIKGGGLHGAESFLRSYQSLTWSLNFSCFVVVSVSLPCSLELAVVPLVVVLFACVSLAVVVFTVKRLYAASSVFWPDCTAGSWHLTGTGTLMLMHYASTRVALHYCDNFFLISQCTRSATRGPCTLCHGTDQVCVSGEGGGVLKTKLTLWCYGRYLSFINKDEGDEWPWWWRQYALRST
jgi:hypothetical protein